MTNPLSDFLRPSRALSIILCGIFSLLLLIPGVMAYTQTEVSSYGDRVKTHIFQTEVEVVKSGSTKANTLLTAAKSKYNSGYSALQQSNLTMAQSLFESAMSYSTQARETAQQRVSVQAAITRYQASLDTLSVSQTSYGDSLTAQLVAQAQSLYSSAASAFGSENYTTVSTYLSNLDTKITEATAALKTNMKIKTRLDRAQRRYQKNLEAHHRQRLATEPLSERYLNEALGLVNHAVQQVAAGDYSRADAYLDRAENSLERFETHHRDALDHVDEMRYRNRRVNNVIDQAQENLRLMKAPRADSMMTSSRSRQGRIANLLAEHDYDRAEMHMYSAEERARRALARSKALMGDSREIEVVIENTGKFMEKVRTALEMSREPLVEYQQEAIFEAFAGAMDQADNAAYLQAEGRNREALQESLAAEEKAREIFLDLQKIVRLIKAEKELKSTKQAELLEELKNEIADVSELMARAYKGVKKQRLQVMKDGYGEAVIEFKTAQKFFEKGRYVAAMTHVKRARAKLFRVLEYDPEWKKEKDEMESGVRP